MKIVLLSPYSNIQGTGLRTLSSSLKNQGHDVKLFFLRRQCSQRYDEDTLNKLVDIIEGSDWVGISLMTNYFDNVVQITQKIKKSLSIPVIWGGIHPTVRPEECLTHADMVCVGEGEETVLEFVKKIEEGQDYLGTRGMWFKHKAEIVKTALRPLISNIDSIPFPDYDWQTHYVLHDNRIQVMNEDLMKFILMEEYMAQPTRGCPFACTYCCNNTLNRMYPEQKPHFRKRSIANVVQELKWVKSNLPFIRRINFNDDAFFLYSEDEIQEFSEEYLRHIGLPLLVGGATPATLTRNKIAFLVEAGLVCIKLGIQSESERTKKLYQRNYSTEQTLATVNMIDEFKDNIYPRYDIILNNPWETDNDLTQTLMVLCKFSVPHELNLFSLNFYPGTDLYEKAKQEGLVNDDLQDVYRKSYNVRLDGLSGRFLNESYMNDLFCLLYVYALNGVKISSSAMSTLTSKKQKPVRSRILYTLMRLRAGLLLKKNLMKKLWVALKTGDKTKFDRWQIRDRFYD